MLQKLRAIFSSAGPTSIVTRPQGNQKVITAGQVVNALMNLPDSSSLSKLLLDANTDITALRYSPIVAAERFLCESVASLPFLVYDRDTKERAEDHAVYGLLKYRPNAFQVPFTFWKTAMQSAIRFGNAFAVIERNGAGQPVDLVLLNPTWVTVHFEGGVKFLEYKSPSLSGTIANEDFIHILGFSDDGICGKPLMAHAQSVIKIGTAVEAYTQKFFSQGHVGNRYLKIAPGTTDEQLAQLVTSWNAAYSGSDNQWKTFVAAYGSELVNLETPNNESQLLELRKFQVSEAARMMRVPPHIIYHYETGGTYANIESQNIDVVINSLQPWLLQIEQEVNLKLLTQDYYAEHLIDARLRGDTLSRYQAYQIARQGGWLSVNDIRRAENMPPIDGGDDYQQTPVGAAPNAPQPQAPTETTAPADQGGNDEASSN